MKKGLVILLMVSLCICSVFANAQEEAATETDGFQTLSIKFGTASQENTLLVQTVKAWAEKVNDATDGNITITCYAGSVLGSSLEMLQSSQLGALDSCVVQPSACADLGAKEMGVLSFPYIFRDYDQYWNVLTGEVGNDLLDKVTEKESTKLVGFGFYPDGARSFFTTEKHPIRSLEDIKDMKIRIQSYAIDSDMAKALGFAATPTAFSEVYSALQAGVVDGAEGPLSTVNGSKFYEVTKYLTLDEHTYNIPTIVFSAKNWAKYNDETKKILKDSWIEAITEARPQIVNGGEEFKKFFAEQGMEIIELNDHDKWVEAMDPLYAKYGAGLEEWIQRIQKTE